MARSASFGVERHRIAHRYGARPQRDTSLAAERERTVGRGDDGRASVAHRDVRGADHERTIAVFVRHMNARVIASDRRPRDQPQRLRNERRRAVDRVAWRTRWTGEGTRGPRRAPRATG